jgi:hypothetical protein
MPQEVSISVNNNILEYYRKPDLFDEKMNKRTAYELGQACGMDIWLKTTPPPTNPRQARLRKHYICAKKVHFATAMMMNAVIKRSKDTFETTRPLLIDAFCDEQSIMSEMVDNSDDIEFNLTTLDKGVATPVWKDSTLDDLLNLKGVRKTHKSEDAYLAKCNYHKKMLDGLDILRPALNYTTLEGYVGWRWRREDDYV